MADAADLPADVEDTTGLAMLLDDLTVRGRLGIREGAAMWETASPVQPRTAFGGVYEPEWIAIGAYAQKG